MKRTYLQLCMALTVTFLAGTVAHAGELFSIEVGTKDNLVILNPQGSEVAKLPSGTIQQPVKVDNTSFIVSYGQDTNQRYSAIIAPDPNQPKAIEFVVAGNRVYADSKASVTVTFASDFKSVSVDPGAFGTVSLNGNRLRSTVATNSAGPASQPQANVQNNTPVTSTASTKTTPEPASSPAPSSPRVAANSAPVNGSGNGSAPGSSNSSMAGTTASRLLTSAITMTPNNVRFWAEPITPPGGRLPSITSNQMKLVEVRGPVTVKLPSGRTTRAKNGMIIPSGSSVRTTSGSSAAVFIGGTNSARLTEDSSAKFSHSASQNTQRTTVDLTRGCVFSKVGKKAGVRQDYKVRTPVGIAAAKGTDYATLYRSDNMHVFVVAGRVFLFDLNGNLLGSASTTNAGQISFISTENLDADGQQELIDEIVDLAGDNNTKVNAILSKMARGIPLTSDEQNYLSNVPTVGAESDYYGTDWDDLSYNPYWGIYYSIIQYPGSYNPTDDYDPLYDILNQPTLAPDSVYDQQNGPFPTTPF